MVVVGGVVKWSAWWRVAARRAGRKGVPAARQTATEPYELLSRIGQLRDSGELILTSNVTRMLGCVPLSPSSGHVCAYVRLKTWAREGKGEEGRERERRGRAAG